MSEVQGAAGPGMVDGTPGNFVFVPEGQTWKEQYLGGDDHAGLRDDPSLADVQDIPTLAKRFIDTKAFVGRKGVILPKDGDAADQERFFKELGRPETVEGYEIKAPEGLPDGFPYAPELEGQFKQWAFEEGLTGKQAQNLFNKYLQTNLAQFEAAQKALKDGMATLAGELKKEWGDKYQENFAIAQKAMGEFFPQGSKALAALDKVMGDDADLIRMAFAIGTRMGEADFIKGGSNNSDDLNARRKELMASEAYLQASHPDHKKVLAEVEQIYKKLYPEGAQQ